MVDVCALAKPQHTDAPSASAAASPAAAAEPADRLFERGGVEGRRVDASQVLHDGAKVSGVGRLLGGG